MSVPISALAGLRRERIRGLGRFRPVLFTFHSPSKIERRADKGAEIRIDLHGSDLSPLAPQISIQEGAV